MITRTKYLQKIVPFIGKPIIKVIIGVRRSGKTVLLAQIREHILQSGVAEDHIAALNFESFANRKYQNADALYALILQQSKAVHGEKLYLFFDEIQ